MSTDSKEGGTLADAGVSITRRDFMGSTLLGAGASLLCAPSPAAAQGPGRSWNGYAGVGDYRFSNGNTADVANSAHRIRDGAYDGSLGNVIDTSEIYDAVIVGAGFAGMAAAYELKKQKPDGSCLILDNHPIFGGEAKQNEFEVDGYRLVAPQGSNSFLVPRKTPSGHGHPAFQYARHYWDELALPEEFEFAKVAGGNAAIVFDKDNFNAMYSDKAATVGYFFQNELTAGKGVWINSIWNDDLKRAPMPEQLKRDLLAWRDYQSPYDRSHTRPPPQWDQWLDTMTLAEFVTNVIGLSADVLKYANAGLATGMWAACADGLSAYAAKGRGEIGLRDDYKYISFPGGNTPLLRHFVKAVFPDAISGPKEFHAISTNAVNFSALDRKDAKLKMRLSATAISVTHEGDPRSADRVSVIYEKGGKLYRVKGKGAVLAIGSWVAKHIAKDLSAEYADALARIPHGPILTVNVALHNWRFLDKLGISAARWFDGFGFFANVRQAIVVGNRAPPLSPDKPAVFTFYVPFLRPGLPIEQQGPAGRMELWSTSYAGFERQIVEHMQRLFAGAGFNAKRDIAGIVLNRWGHAFFSPPPGFFFGKDGMPSPLKVLGQPFGRIAFGHSELSGHRTQTWETATFNGRRALLQVLERA